ncbi:hypothetical protein E8E13_006041 [Curvularia kusanoi]|uniref:RING-type domain-containing protein n=1 Tax=Curvularia kusanoi TaxID=90978 RepID=A0A9P4WDR2_CURKU|nr:hypothetical protein E8E13_006041 [Curvularia kusanoi]
MSIFANRTMFMELGLEKVAPSTAIMHQDCYICNNPLNVNAHATPTDAHHSAIRIGVCGYLHGEECLAAWLQTGNTCPICKRMLFEVSGLSLSQNALNSVIRTMGPLVGEARVMLAIARLIGERDSERLQLNRNYEEVAEARLRPDGEMNDEDWFSSSSEEDFNISIDEGADESDTDSDGQDVRMDENADVSVALDEEDEEL